MFDVIEGGCEGPFEDAGGVIVTDTFISPVIVSDGNCRVIVLCNEFVIWATGALIVHVGCVTGGGVARRATPFPRARGEGIKRQVQIVRR